MEIIIWFPELSSHYLEENLFYRQMELRFKVAYHLAWLCVYNIIEHLEFL